MSDKPMTQERYTFTNDKNGMDRLCPFCFGGPDPYAEIRCSGSRCMARIIQCNELGITTGLGRCGMVQQHINKEAINAQ